MARPFTGTTADATLEAEAWGDPGQPAVLLIAGTSCTRDWWPPAFCAQLADRGMCVIRYDQRDTGASTTWPVGRPGYRLTDLARDALAVLDAAGVARAHLVGFSQGGWVAQLLALDHPDRVASLTLVATRPTEHGPADPDLPDVTNDLMAAWERLVEPDWRDPSAVLEYYVANERALAGAEFDESAARAICHAAIDRSRDLPSAGNHPLMPPSPRWRERLGELDVATTVIHGAADPLFPVPNAHALAAAIPGARLRVLEGVGHEFPARAWPEVIGAVTRALARGGA